MLKTAELLIKKLTTRENVGGVRMENKRVTAGIEQMLQEYLQSSEDSLVFEASASALDATLAVIDIPPLSLTYDIIQIDETLFEARLKELEM